MVGDRSKFAIGPDGLPTDPRHPFNADIDPKTERANWISRRLAECENAWRAGSLHAIFDATVFCAEVKMPPPAWLLIAIETLVARQLLVHSGRGKFNSRQKVFNENQKHFLRWDMMRELLESARKLYERFEDDRGLSVEKARAAVAEKLNEMGVEGGEDAVKYSNGLVERRLAEGRGNEFYLPRFKPSVKPG